MRDRLAPAQHGDGIGIGHHLAKLVRDDDDRALPAARKCADVAEHFVGFLWREHRGGLVQN